MRSILPFTLLVAGICASVVPDTSFEPGWNLDLEQAQNSSQLYWNSWKGTVASRDSRFITGPIENQVIEGIEEISQAIRDGELDPFLIEKESFAYELPVPVLFNAAAFVEQVLSTGLSDIVVNYMNYSLLFSRLNFELELPHLHFSTRVANADVTLFGNRLTVEADGRVDIRRTIVLGEVRVNLGIISGISISGVTVDFTLGSIASNIRLAIQGLNYSQQINDVISQTVPATLQEYRGAVNELIEIILLDAINENIVQ